MVGLVEEGDGCRSEMVWSDQRMVRVKTRVRVGVRSRRELGWVVGEWEVVVDVKEEDWVRRRSALVSWSSFVV
jgi:hypothetical protein